MHIQQLGAFFLVMTAALHGSHKEASVKSPDERLIGCEERALQAYATACAARKQFERDNQTILNSMPHFNNSMAAAVYQDVTDTINKQAAQLLLEERANMLAKCRAKNAKA